MVVPQIIRNPDSFPRVALPFCNRYSGHAVQDGFANSWDLVQNPATRQKGNVLSLF